MVLELHLVLSISYVHLRSNTWLKKINSTTNMNETKSKIKILCWNNINILWISYMLPSCSLCFPIVDIIKTIWLLLVLDLFVHLFSCCFIYFRASLDKGFKLLYFLTSTVSPSYELTQQCEAFLRGSKHILAKTCLDSVRRTKEWVLKMFSNIC